MSSSHWSADDASSPRPPRRLAAHRLFPLYRHLFLWVLQAWVAMFYIAAGYAKLTQPNQLLGLLMTWPAKVDPAVVHVVGGAEVALALGLVSPLLSWRALHGLMWASAAGLSLNAGVMAVSHAALGEPGPAVLNGLIVSALAAILAGRRRPPPAIPLR